VTDDYMSGFEIWHEKNLVRGGKLGYTYSDIVTTWQAATKRERERCARVAIAAAIRGGK
jgi:hypothetical protein